MAPDGLRPAIPQEILLSRVVAVARHLDADAAPVVGAALAIYAGDFQGFGAF